MHYESTEFEDVSDADFRSLKELIRNSLSHGIVLSMKMPRKKQ